MSPLSPSIPTHPSAPRLSPFHLSQLTPSRHGSAKAHFPALLSVLVPFHCLGAFCSRSPRAWAGCSAQCAAPQFLWDSCSALTSLGLCSKWDSPARLLPGKAMPAAPGKTCAPCYPRDKHGSRRRKTNASQEMDGLYHQAVRSCCGAQEKQTTKPSDFPVIAKISHQRQPLVEKPKAHVGI